MKIVFLVEEQSMRAMLGGLLPRLLPDLPCIVIPHEGKSDLEKSIPRKLRAWKEPGVRFVVVRDKDAGDCRKAKQRLTELCKEGKREDTLVRIACHEMESWFLGDLQAVDKGLGTSLARKWQNKSAFRDPDSQPAPANRLKKIAETYQKISGSRAIGEHLSLAGNRSRSFCVFVEGVKKLAAQMAGVAL